MIILRLLQSRIFFILIGLLLFTLLFSCGNADFLTSHERDWLKQHDKMIDVLVWDDRPSYFYNEEGDYVGLAVDYINEMESILGFTFNFKNFDNWDKLLEYSKDAENFIIVGITRTSERERYLNFSNSIISIPHVIVIRKNKDISSIKDLYEKKVCSIKNYAVNDFLKEQYPDLLRYDVEDAVTGVRAVSFGDYDAMVINQMVVTWIIDDQYITNLKIIGEIGYNSRSRVAVSKKNPFLFNIIEKAIDQIEPRKRDDIVRKWVNSGIPVISEQQRNIIIIAAGFILFIILFLWLWLASLKGQVARKTKQYRESELRYRMLIEGSIDAICLSSGKKILQVNRAFEDLFGYTFAEIEREGPGLMFIVAPESRKLIQERLDRLNSSMIDAANYEFTGLTRSGEKLSIEISVNYIDIGDSFITQSIMRDASERKRREIELVSAKNRAEESDRLKSAFLANMSHEIRTPMNGILGFSKLLNNPELNSEQREVYIEIIQQSGQRLLNTVNDLVDISMIETNQVQLIYSEININQKLENYYTFFRDKLNEKQIKFSYEVELPTDEAVFRTDESKFESILGNLLNNAYKYTEDGFIEYGYNLLRNENKILFYVKDSGIGIEPQQIDHIFSRFVQLDSSYTRSHEGSGLGLAITKSYTELLGGELWVESIPGQGSIFYFTLPY